MKKLKGKITGAIVAASGLFVLSGCSGNVKTTTTTTHVSETTDETTTEAVRYTMSFVTNCDEEIEDIVAKAGDLVTLPTMEREGYAFKGWFTDKDFTNPYITTKMPSKDITLYAKWQANTYRITFELNGGDSMNSLYVAYMDEIPEIEDPVRTGYTFTGWEEEIPKIMPAEDLTLTATWEKNTYSATFILDNGEENITAQYLYDDPITYPTPEKEGYVFKGWSGDFASDTMPASDLVLTAVWEAITYTITYNTDEGELNAAVTSYSITDSVTLPVPVKAGYTFLGWYLDENLTESISEIEEGTTGNISLYASYYHDFYTMSFDMAGGEEVQSLSYHYGDRITYPDGVRRGYTLSGYAPHYDTMPAENVTVTALWTADLYTITYVTEGTCDGVTSFSVEDTVNLPVPVYEDYIFMGWYLDKDYTTKVTEITDTASDVTLYALWQYSISYASGVVDGVSLDYSTVSELPSSYTPADDILLPDAYVSGGRYTFDGWYLDSSYTEPVSEIEKGTKMNLTLYPKFVYTEYAISYDAGDGTMPESYAKTYTVLGLGSLPVPSLKGYTFTGWYDNDGNLVENIEQGTMGSISLTAKYEMNTYTVSYVFLDGKLDGKSIPSSYLPEGTVTSFTIKDSFDINLPVKDGFFFDGMYLDTDKSKSASSVSLGTAENITVYVTYLATTYSITYDKSKGDYILNCTDSNYTLEAEPDIATPERDGYEFLGWYLDEDLTEAYVYDADRTGNLCFYPKWRGYDYVVTYNMHTDDDGTYDSYVTCDGHTGSYSAAYNAEDSYPTPVRDGYIFLGWYYDEDCTFPNMQRAAYDGAEYGVYAKWQAWITMDGNQATSLDYASLYEISGITDIVIPKSVDGVDLLAIGDSAMCCDLLTTSHVTSITVPEGVTYIGTYAFSEHENCTSLSLPSTLTSIGTYAFSAMAITSITFNSNITAIPAMACIGCESLTTVTIEATSSISLGYGSFQYCSSLTSIYYYGSKDTWDASSKNTTWNDGTGNYVLYIGLLSPRPYTKAGVAYGYLTIYYRTFGGSTVYTGYVAPDQTIKLTEDINSRYTYKVVNEYGQETGDVITEYSGSEGDMILVTA